MTFNELIQQYLDHMRYERNFADTTIFGRKKMLTFFLKFAGDEPLSTLLIRKFTRYLAQERNWQPQSVKDAVRDIKCFTKYLYFCGMAPEDYGYKICQPKVPERLPKTISANEVEKLYSQPAPVHCASRTWITYSFYFEFLAKTGLRKTESKLLCAKHFNFEEGTILIFGKGRRETYCLIPPDMSERFKNWFEERELAPDDLVFIGRDGKVLNDEGIRFALQLRAKKACVTRHVYPHLIRHFFATDLIKNNVNLFKVQRFMRHKSIRSTQVYLNLVLDDLKEDLTKHSLINKDEKARQKALPDDKKTVINIYNPNFIDSNYNKWSQEYFMKGGVSDGPNQYSSEPLPEPQLDNDGRRHL